VAVPADVGDEEACERLVERSIRELGRLDILVSNAAIASPRKAPFHEIATDVWRETLAVNLDGAFYCGRAAARHMVAHGYGRIVNVSNPHPAICLASAGGALPRDPRCLNRATRSEPGEWR